MNLFTSFIYEDISIKFTENVYDYDKKSVKKFCLHFKKRWVLQQNQDVLKFKICQPALHKMYMIRIACLRVILVLF